MRTPTMTIGEVARRAGVAADTVRFYEHQGLLEEPARRPSGYREYDEGVVARLRFIQKAKDLGFTLKEVGELLALRSGTDSTCADVRRQAAAKLADVEAKLLELQRIRDALATLVASCRGSGPTSDCPILDALGEGGERP
jgi:MerR family transcriptional regulator, copper efflux regulator